jgi:hypothetical protein
VHQVGADGACRGERALHRSLVGLGEPQQQEGDRRLAWFLAVWGRRVAGQPGFFDADERLKAVSVAGDPLQRLSKVVDIEVFREELEAALVRSDRAKGGRTMRC